MATPSARAQVARRNDRIAAIVNEYFQARPYPQNQWPRTELITELRAYADELVQAAYGAVKENASC
jgi:hypothetical protein